MVLNNGNITVYDRSRPSKLNALGFSIMMPGSLNFLKLMLLRNSVAIEAMLPNDPAIPVGPSAESVKLLDSDLYMFSMYGSIYLKFVGLTVYRKSYGRIGSTFRMSVVGLVFDVSMLPSCFFSSVEASRSFAA